MSQFYARDRSLVILNSASRILIFSTRVNSTGIYVASRISIRTSPFTSATSDAISLLLTTVASRERGKTESHQIRYTRDLLLHLLLRLLAGRKIVERKPQHSISSRRRCDHLSYRASVSATRSREQRPVARSHVIEHVAPRSQQRKLIVFSSYSNIICTFASRMRGIPRWHTYNKRGGLADPHCHSAGADMHIYIGDSYARAYIHTGR